MSDKEKNEDVPNEIDIEKLDGNKVIEYSNILLPVIADALDKTMEESNDNNISTDELILALCTVVPQAILESIDNKKYTLLEINQLVNSLLFELKNK